MEIQLLIDSTDETTLLPNRFHLHVDRTMKLLEAQEATNGKFQITIEDLGPKVRAQLAFFRPQQWADL